MRKDDNDDASLSPRSFRIDQDLVTVRCHIVFYFIVWRPWLLSNDCLRSLYTSLYYSQTFLRTRNQSVSLYWQDRVIWLEVSFDG